MSHYLELQKIIVNIANEMRVYSLFLTYEPLTTVRLDKVANYLPRKILLFSKSLCWVLLNTKNIQSILV